MRTRRRWRDLDNRTRRLLLVTAGVEGLLKTAALVDLIRRPADEIRGSKRRWAAAIVLVNSAGVVPITYFVRGRRRHQHRTGK
jgi:hypothetical protein